MTQRYQHVFFCKLKIGEDFFSGKFRYTKSSYFLGRTVLDGNAVFVLPWTKIRSTRPFGKLANCAVGTDNVCFGSAAGNVVIAGQEVSVHLCTSSVARPLRVIPAATEPVAGECHDKPIV